QRPASAIELCRELRSASASPPPPKLESLSRGSPRRARPSSTDLFRTIVTPHDGEVDLWRKIPAGEGWIGSPDGVGDDDERPRHRIEVIQQFWMAAVPVTNSQYAAFDSGRADLKRPDHPIVNVSWDDAMNFCRWLDEKGFRGARLPTEEEWEYACRAGSETRYWNGDSERDLDAVGWYKMNSGGSTRAVGEKPANPWGLYDVHGNVWEWTCTPWKVERYKDRLVSAPISVDPAAEPEDLAAPSSARRVVRGGSFTISGYRARSAYRTVGVPRYWWLQGFRVALPLPPAGGRS
ncbi:MAG: SUMF1/EgtB/PvdO family nonheme iron enzyme, partial [Acidobacteriota bacterium]